MFTHSSLIAHEKKQKINRNIYQVKIKERRSIIIMTISMPCNWLITAVGCLSMLDVRSIQYKRGLTCINLKCGQIWKKKKMKHFLLTHLRAYTHFSFYFISYQWDFKYALYCTIFRSGLTLIESKFIQLY